MSTADLQALHEARRLLAFAHAERKSEELRAENLEKLAYLSWITRLSDLADQVVSQERLGNVKVAERAQERMKEAIEEHKRSRLWDQIRGIGEHIDMLDELIEVREYVVERLLMRVGFGGEEMRDEMVEMRDTEMEGGMRSGGEVGARSGWSACEHGRREV